LVQLSREQAREAVALLAENLDATAIALDLARTVA
jgi:hypothetical protein